MPAAPDASDSAVKLPAPIPCLFAFCLGSVAACGGGGSAPGDDAGTGGAEDAAHAADAGPGDDAAVVGADGGGGVCAPTPGTEMVSASCDLVEVAVLTHDDAASEVVVSGRVSLFGGSSGCAAIDAIDLVEGAAASPVVQHFDGGASIPLDSGARWLGRAAPTAALTDVCATDDPARRFESFGVVIRGRVDGGTFEATCARADSGSHWPPALRVTCHHGVAAPPSEAYTMVSLGSFMGMPFSSTMLGTAVAHEAGAALTSVDPTIHVIPQRSFFDPGPPLAPHDTTGWMGSANESGETPPRSQLQAFSTEDTLGLELCPPPMDPGPGYVPPPVFLARLTGQGQRGAYATEVFVGACHTTTTP